MWTWPHPRRVPPNEERPRATLDLMPAVRAALAALSDRAGRVFRPVHRIHGGWIAGEA